MSPDKLVMMANQIGRFFAGQKRGQPVAEITTHLQKFWEPRMRTAILAHLDSGGAGLDPPVRAAVAALRPAKTNKADSSFGANTLALPSE